jgi:hypothetical protein
VFPGQLAVMVWPPTAKVLVVQVAVVPLMVPEPIDVLPS